MNDGTRFVFFRSDSMVLLVSHPNQPTLYANQRQFLLEWIQNQAKEILTNRPSPPSFAANGPGFSFTAEKNGHAHLSSTLTPEAIRRPSGAAQAAQAGKPAPAENLVQDSSLSKAQGGSLPNADVAPPSFTVVIQPVSGTSPAEIVKLTKRLSQVRPSFNAMANVHGNFALEQVALNWYHSGGHDGIGSGGPGGRPAPAPGAITDGHSFTLPLAIRNLLQNGKAASKVQVAILDTSPTADAIGAAMQNFAGNQLLQTLPGHLTLYIDNANQFPTVPVAGHDYTMSDHGLFVAGIIHSIVPEAELHLFQVLSDKGVGDAETIARGFFNASELIVKDTLIHGPSKWAVNASLMMDSPANDGQLTSMLESIKDQQNLSDSEKREQDDLLKQLEEYLNDPKEDMPNWLQTQQSLAVEYMCRFLHYNRNTYVVAAAGNDGKRGQPQLGARYPAKARGVLGVGALAQDGADASYSNVDDDPPADGMVTLGGEVSTPAGEVLAPDGVIGLYIGSFPAPLAAPGVPPPPAPGNKTGWAEWAGTSFATPVITGIVAVLLRTGHYANAEAAITGIRQSLPSTTAVGIAQRVVLPVTQSQT